MWKRNSSIEVWAASNFQGAGYPKWREENNYEHKLCDALTVYNSYESGTISNHFELVINYVTLTRFFYKQLKWDILENKDETRYLWK